MQVRLAAVAVVLRFREKYFLGGIGGKCGIAGLFGGILVEFAGTKRNDSTRLCEFPVERRSVRRLAGEIARAARHLKQEST